MYLRPAHRLLIGLALVAAAAVAIYLWRGPAVIDEAGQAATSLWRKASAPPPPSAEEQQRSQARRAATDSGPGPARTAAVPRKCQLNGQTIYTDGACPDGSQEQMVPENLSVIPR
ncbi:hypothetical protein HS961_03555 [Comamonas piscis]|uniref:DUF4124 domain-containing protein n=1 Tax=Comamonas piscis TaxID=1562974 RepID=A0A7G5EDA5_9BURK|nr:hypothetical protein [Comamonas piscis]QMV71980.1 hypothetical protein HS961_03555 [Comamonas piscis]WSO34725.1 hypothetical protein VUJ63_03580 [Comamonas piscis]